MSGDGDCSCSKCRFFAAVRDYDPKNGGVKERSKTFPFLVITPQLQLTCDEEKKSRVEKLPRFAACVCDPWGRVQTWRVCECSEYSEYGVLPFLASPCGGCEYSEYSEYGVLPFGRNRGGPVSTVSAVSTGWCNSCGLRTRIRQLWVYKWRTDTLMAQGVKSKMTPMTPTLRPKP